MNKAVIVREEIPSKFVVFDKTNNKTIKYSKHFLKKLYELQLLEIENPAKLYGQHI